MRRRLTGRATGALSSEYAGVSSDKMGENPIRRKPKVSRGKARPPWVSRVLRFSRTARPMAETVNIPLLPLRVTWGRSSDAAAG